MKRSIIVTLALGACLAIAASASADVVGGLTMDFVPILGDASALNGTGWGTSGDTFTDPAAFRMGKFEVTRTQWDVFVAAAGAPTGTPANAFDNAPTTTGNQPVNNVSFYETIQFVNWLNVSAGKQAAYNVVGGVFDVWSVGDSYEGTNRYRHKDAFYFLPDLDEVLKAAYWNGTSFNTYANATNTLPTPAESCFSASGGLWNVGSGAVELNGTFDMMGNMGEIQEQDFGYAYSTGNVGHRLGPGASIVPSMFAAYAGWTGFNANASVEATYFGLRVGSSVTGGPIGDFDGDGDVDAFDIDELADAIRLGWTDAKYDLTGDTLIDTADLDMMVRSLVETAIGNGTEYGDFNLDGQIDTTDLTRLATFYGPGSTWDDGNANRNIDLVIDNTDLTILATYYGFGVPDVVPEPMTLSLLVLGGLAILRRRKS